MIKRNPACRALGLGALTLLFCLACTGEEPVKDDAPKVEKRLTRQLRPELLAPDNAVFYVSTSDIRRVKAAFERSAFKNLLAEDDILTPVTTAFGKLRDTYVKGDGTRSDAETKRRGEEVDLLLKLLPMLESQAAIAIDGDAAGLSNITAGKLPRFLLIASMPAGDAGLLRQQDIDQVFDNYRGRLTIDAHYRDFDSDRGNYRLHGLENTDLGIYEEWTFVENLFVYGQGKGVVSDAIGRFTDKKGVGSLALNANYQSAYKQVGRDEKGESLAYVQFDPRSFMSKENSANPWLQYVMSLSGSADPEYGQMAFGLTVGEGVNAAIREKLFVRTPPQKESSAKPTEGCKGVSSRFASGDELFYWATQANLYDFYSQNKELLGSFFGGSTQMEQKLSGAVGAKETPELKKKMDLFKGEFSVFADYSPRGAKLTAWSDLLNSFQLVLCLEVDRENPNIDAALKELMTKLESGTGVPYLTTNASGAIIHYQRGLAVGEDRATSNLGLRANMAATEAKNTPFFAAWAKIDLEVDAGSPQRHFVLLSDDLPSLRKAMAQRGSPRTSLAEDVRFKDVMKSFRESRSEIAYFDLAKLANVYNSLMPLVTKAELLDRDTVDKLPSINSLKPHLFPMAAARSSASNGSGVLTEFSSPTGNLSLAGLIASVAWPAINTQRQRGISEEVDGKFKQIMLYLQLYSADFDRFPPQLSDLLSTNYIDPKHITIFESPFNRGALQTPQDIDNPDLTNIIYLPNRTLLDLGNEIMAYERQPTRLEKGDGRLLYHVLSVDGRVRGMPKAALERALQNKFSSTMIGEKGKGATGTTPPKRK